MSKDSPEPPTPIHLLRSHGAPIAALHISDDNERIYSGDQSGKVVITSTRSLRPIVAWNAHKDALLTVREWRKYIVTHGRDDKLLLWSRIDELPSVGGAAGAPVNTSPTLCRSMDVNSLNFCRFSLLDITPDTSGDGEDEPRALLALPNLVDSSTVDIWSLPDRERVHATIGQEVAKSIFSKNPTGRNTSGVIMALHIFHQSPLHSSVKLLSLVTAYENGSVVLRRYTNKGKATSVEGQGWDTVWSSKLHGESIMGMAVSADNSFALSVSADHLIGRFNLNAPDSSSAATDFVAHRTKHPGNSTVAIRSDGRVCAVGGWDGTVRLYSTKTFKPLGSLKYHKVNCQVLAFANATPAPQEATFMRSAEDEDASDDDSDDDENEMSPAEKEARSRWLIAGAKDCRVSIWELISFAKS